MLGMGKLGAGEVIVIITLALLIFGPNKLPEVGKSVGNALKEFRTGINKVDEDIKQSIYGDEDQEE